MRERERERKCDNGREKAIENAIEKKTRDRAQENALEIISATAVYIIPKTKKLL